MFNWNSYCAWAVKNSIVIICFTALAIHFNKWWIILFSIFCMSSLKTSPTEHRLVCDKCGKQSPSASSQSEALEVVHNLGWKRVKVEDKFEDYCPDCQKGMGNEYR